MFLKASGESFASITGMHTHFLFCLVYQYCIFWWSYYLLEYHFYSVVLNHFCDSWSKIDGLFYFARSGNTKIISSENKIILTRPSLVVTYSSRQLIMLFYDFCKTVAVETPSKKILCLFLSKVLGSTSSTKSSFEQELMTCYVVLIVTLNSSYATLL